MLGGSVHNENGSSLVNDVWETLDGRTWKQHVFANIWSPRAFFGAVARGPTRIYVMGGVGDASDSSAGGGTGDAGRRRVALNDVWLWSRHSEISARVAIPGEWVCLTRAAAWTPRAAFGVGILPANSTGDRLYVLGGQRPGPGVRDFATQGAGNRSDAVEVDNVLSDVWLSDDGKEWRLATATAEWGAHIATSSAGRDSNDVETLVGAGARRDFATLTHSAASGGAPYIIVMGGLRRLQTPRAPGQPFCPPFRRGEKGTQSVRAPTKAARAEAGERHTDTEKDRRSTRQATSAARVLRWEAVRDIWRSYDGQHWEVVVQCADWPARYRFGAVSDGRQLVVVGGLKAVPLGDTLAGDGVGGGSEARVAVGAYADIWQVTMYIEI